MAAALTTVDHLLADPPTVHGTEEDGDLMTHGLLPDALRFIESTVEPGWRTLETGSGLSTITFSMLGADHTCVVPLQHEVDRIQAYCRERGVSTERVRFHVEPSELVLPTLPPDPLDFVLIDGSHSFPQVFIDWFYTQRRLEVGGTMMIDDVHVWTGRVLRDFLLAEPEWTLSTTWSARTAVFTKVAPTDDDKVWFEQAYVWRRTRPATLGRARMAAALIRSGEFREFGRRVAQTVRPG